MEQHPPEALRAFPPPSPGLRRYHLLMAVWVSLLVAPAWAHAQSVALAGMLGSKALLVVDAHPPRAVGAGDEYQGVKVIAITKEEATVEVKGARRTLRLGEAPVSVGGRSGSASGRRVTLTADSRGHFVNSGSINGQVMQYMVDTGASTIAIGRPDADRMGLKYQNGQPVRMSTANGIGQGWRMKLDSVRIGDVEVFGVEAIITSQPMPYVLLGNSFLNEFQMTRSNDQMVLEKRN
ncbi:MAG: TIGR02281 family clan AA aspartic protease [Acidovorax sp.]|nr:TIGR02281 family clan AA aspartic protease [Acidovorax sp.]